MISYIIVFNPNLREEQYLLSYKPIRKTDDIRIALRMDREHVLQAADRLIGVGISFEIRNVDY